MKISIIGTNGMISIALTKEFFSQANIVDVYGLDVPIGYSYSSFTQVNLLKDTLNYDFLVQSDMIVYAAGAGVQAALSTDSSLIYTLNVNVPIEITLQLKKHGYKGRYVSFGSYMEIGLNDDEGKCFNETDVICSSLPVTNDYALSKRLYSRYMNDFNAEFTYWHFILPNMFSYNDLMSGTRLIPYTIEYLKKYNNGDHLLEPQFSAGLQTRQFILLEDIYQVIQKAVECNIPSDVYNIGGGELMSIRSIIKRLFSIYHVPCKDSFFGKEVRRDGDIKALCINGDKLYNAIHYLPNSKLEDIFDLS